MSVLALAILNSDNYPVLIRTRHDYDSSSMNEEENMNLLYNLNAALDIVEERQNQAQNKDSYLGLLNQCETYKIYGLLSATKTKILLMVSTSVGNMFRDTEARNTLKQLHSLYTDVVTYNPFYQPGSEVKSDKLEDLVKTIFGISVDYSR
ncbi:trafficking protein particle complex subunit 2-like protein [Brevipalpus obovatus]|uniref:trafficking protein particle complex subunit 2-like protein n=1 Tax=Brevipalpus obovatus TaxID=246614 RepID=UPI003D9EABF4